MKCIQSTFGNTKPGRLEACKLAGSINAMLLPCMHASKAALMYATILFEYGLGA